MAHPKPSSRLLCQLKKGTRSAPLLDWGAIGGVGWGDKQIIVSNCKQSHKTVFYVLNSLKMADRRFRFPRR